MARSILSLVLFVALVWSGGFAADIGALDADQFKQQIDGRKNPEKIPPHVAWEHFFLQVVDVAFDAGVMNDANVRALGVLNIGISEQNARLLAQIAKQTIDATNALRQPLNDEHMLPFMRGGTTARHMEAESFPARCLVGAAVAPPQNEVAFSGGLWVEDLVYDTVYEQQISIFGPSIYQVITVNVPTSTDSYQQFCEGTFTFGAENPSNVSRSDLDTIPQTLDIPGESTQTLQWEPSEPTVHTFKVTLSGIVASFAGRLITEDTGPGGVTDGCHYPEALPDPVGPVPPSTLQLNSNDYTDSVGWLPLVVTYYQGSGRPLPCNSTTDQAMLINTRGGSATPRVVYKNNPLIATISATGVHNRRGNAEIGKDWQGCC